jgi:hypothetical protein
MEDLQKTVEHARTALSEEEYRQLKAAVETLGYLTALVEDKDMSLRRLRQILFGASTEKTRNVVGEKEGKQGTETGADGSAAAQGQMSSASAPAPTATEEGAKAGSGSEEKPEGPRVPGHGRNGAEAYTGARKVFVAHTEVQVGQRCPLCWKGKLYELRTPGVLIRVTGQAPLTATMFQLQKIRCNLCGEVFTAEPPAGVGTKKYDEAAAAMLAVLRYGRGIPFYRLEGLQNNLGIPLPASTQFEILEETSGVLAPAYEELIRQAAQGEVVYNDDTGVKILELMKENEEKQKQKGRDAPEKAAGGEGKVKKSDSERTGMHTTGVVSTREGQKIALFFSGRKHAGENLAEVLKRRAQELGPPIQMCDALDYNVPKGLAVILGNCNVHARRKVVEVAEDFPAECKKVLDIFVDVYKAEAETQKLGLSPAERLAYHQAHSGPRMKELEEWIAAQFAERRVEPNSGLGKALKYFENHWEKLMLFLRVAGAPLDSNIVERALKKAILQRKNSLFYKTQKGAAVGDMFTSFIHTCELNEVNAYDYLIELQKHADEASRNPTQWMPWNYRETLRRLDSSTRSSAAVA